MAHFENGIRFEERGTVLPTITLAALRHIPNTLSKYFLFIKACVDMLYRDYHGFMRLYSKLTLEEKKLIFVSIPLPSDENRNRNRNNPLAKFLYANSTVRELLKTEHVEVDAAVLTKTMVEVFGFTVQEDSPKSKTFVRGAVVAKLQELRNRNSCNSTFLRFSVFNDGAEEHAIKLELHQVEYALDNAITQLDFERGRYVDVEKVGYQQRHNGQRYYVTHLSNVRDYSHPYKFVRLEEGVLDIYRENGRVLANGVQALLNAGSRVAWHMQGNFNDFHKYWGKEKEKTRNLMVCYRGCLYVVRNLSEGIDFSYQYEYRSVPSGYGINFDSYKLHLTLGLIPIPSSGN